jgi:hypothetical protein
MNMLVVSTFEVSGLTSSALSMLKAAVLYAKENRRENFHTMSIDAFCHLAGLPSLAAEPFRLLFREACRAVAIVETVDVSGQNSSDLPYSSWPVFEKAGIDGDDVIFQVCKYTFCDELIVALQNLRPSRRQKHRGEAFSRRLDAKSSVNICSKPALVI